MMEILKSVKIVPDDTAFDEVVLKAYLNVAAQVTLSKEVLYSSSHSSELQDSATRQLLGTISRIVFAETIDILRKEAHELMSKTYKCKDYESGRLMRETAVKLLELSNKMENI